MDPRGDEPPTRQDEDEENLDLLREVRHYPFSCFGWH